MVMRVIIGLCLIVSLALGCDDEPPPALSPAPTSQGNLPPPPPPPPPTPTTNDQPTGETPQKLVAMELTDKDFVPGPGNRDPFQPLKSKFQVAIRKVVKRQYDIILPRYSLDELKLMAVVTGNRVKPRAMFLDPTGLGVSVFRGQRIGKNAAMIKRILDDKVVVEIEEQAEEKTERVDHVIYLHPKEAKEDETEGEGDEQEGTLEAKAQK